MEVINQRVYRRNGAYIKEILVKDMAKAQAREARENLLKHYSKIHMAPFEMYDDRPRLHPDKTYEELNYKGYIFYIWLNSKFEGD